MSEFQSELTALINKHSYDAMTNTPDYILSAYLCNCISAYDVAKRNVAAHEKGITWTAESDGEKINIKGEMECSILTFPNTTGPLFGLGHDMSFPTNTCK